jgi:hypothetical protein
MAGSSFNLLVGDFGSKPSARKPLNPIKFLGVDVNILVKPDPEEIVKAD